MSTDTRTVGTADEQYTDRPEVSGYPGIGRTGRAVASIVGRGLGILVVATALVVATTLVPAGLQPAAFLGSVLGLAVATPTLSRWVLTGRLAVTRRSGPARRGRRGGD